MKPLPAPNLPGKTEFERFDNAMRQVLSVSKEELLKREAKWSGRGSGRSGRNGSGFDPLPRHKVSKTLDITLWQLLLYLDAASLLTHDVRIRYVGNVHRRWSEVKWRLRQLLAYHRTPEPPL